MSLDQLTVEEFTTPSPHSVEPTTKLPQVWQAMQDHGIRHVLVKGQGEDILGILSQRDVTAFSQSDDFENIEAQDVMSRDIFTATPETKLYEVALKMSEEKIGSAIITGEGSDSLGIFTATDALNALVEVLRGDIQK